MGDEYNCKNWLQHLRDCPEKSTKKIVRGSGPGGQKRNKTSNAVQLRYYHLSSQASEERSFEVNYKRAFQRLFIAIAADGTPSYHNRSGWSKIALQKKAKQVRLVSENNPAFAQSLGHLIDLFVCAQGDWKVLPESLAISASRMNKWFADNPKQKKLFLKIKHELRQQPIATDQANTKDNSLPNDFSIKNCDEP